MKKLLASTILAAGLYALAGSAQAAECGEVSIAEMNWASAGVAAHVDKFILENGYGCTVTLVTGDTMPTFASMNEKAQPDMAPELWVNAVRTPLDAAIKEGRLIEAAKILSEGGVEGWWIPKFVADAQPRYQDGAGCAETPRSLPGTGRPVQSRHSQLPVWLELPGFDRQSLSSAIECREGRLPADRHRLCGRPRRLDRQRLCQEDRLARLLLGTDRHPRQVRNDPPLLRR